MTKKNGATALRGSAWPEKPFELFYVPHPKVGRVLLGPFLTLADAELGIVAVLSPGAVVISALIDCLGDFTHWHGQSSGAVVRLFAGAAREVPND
ncbi:hypothetical protein [Pseudomonas sp. D(2018)]|uniref:hypothetical protein n=1 Tax=Pseudomonas sp. D(2018) TaxID=2502238 RepID=UPI0010F82CAC|nr:hypothetical protein [Pseudomonas sp. D(2018)]